MPGATAATDILMEYAGYIADFLIGVQSTLSAGINNATTSIPVVSGANIANGNYIQIDSEILLVTAGGGTNSLTATRAQLGSTAVAHNSGANVIVLPFGIQVPIMRSLNSFAWFIASEASRPRGDLDAGFFDQQAMMSAEFIWNRDYRQGKAIYKQSELGKSTDEYSTRQGPQGPREKDGA
jgi:hypothetical protein